MRVAKVDTTVPSLLNTWMVMIIDSVIFFLLALYLDHIFSSSTIVHSLKDVSAVPLWVGVYT